MVDTDEPIDLEDEFESGDDAPPGHPRCRCTLTYEVDETEQDQASEEA